MGKYALETGDKYFKRGTILVPMDILGTMQAFCDFSHGQEYGLFLSADIDLENLTANIAPEVWEMPKQNVTAASIAFDEYASDKQIYNAACHRHPSGCRSFSGTDWEYVNKDFDVSFIFLDGGQTPDGVITIKIADGSFVHIPADVKCAENLDATTFMQRLKAAKALAAENGATEELFKEKVSWKDYGYTSTGYNYDQLYGRNYYGSYYGGTANWNKKSKKKKIKPRRAWYW
jgi:hypothetical protein